MKYSVLLPWAGLAGRPHIKRLRKFADHGTFSTYLQAWQDAGYFIHWTTGVDAFILPTGAVSA